MIAEIHGKLSSTGSNLSDRLEDNLTGCFFGALRYIPFDHVLKPVLVAGIRPPEAAAVVAGIHSDLWDDRIAFWPQDEEGELDALVQFDDVAIGIEVKLFSGLSSDDEIDNARTVDDPDAAYRASRHQLSRESRIVQRRAPGKAHRLLLFVADEFACRKVCEDAGSRDLIDRRVMLCHISWQAMLDQLEVLPLNVPYERVIVRDLVELLMRKGFERFRGFRSETVVDERPTFDFRIPDFFSRVAKTIQGFGTDGIDGGMFYDCR